MEQEARQRINSQISVEDKRAAASSPLCLIDNCKDKETTKRQVEELKKFLDKQPRVRCLWGMRQHQD